MFRIVRFPQRLVKFFAPLEGFFHWDHFQYFRNLVLAMAFSWGRRNVVNLCRYLEARTHRTRHNNFLLLDRWDPPAALRKKADCRELGIPFRKTTELAADLIGEFTPPEGVKVVALFDSYYLCKTVVKACRAKGFRFASTLKANRNLFRGGRKLKAGKYAHSAWKRGSKETIRRRNATYRLVDAGWMGVGNLGPLHVVLSRKQGERKVLGIVSDDPDLSARQIVETYTHRWPIEVFFKDVKQPKNCHAAAMSTSEAQNELRRLVWRDLVAYLEDLPDGTSVVNELERLLVA